MSKTDVFVKICGITRKEDLHKAIVEGASAVGFIAFKKSPRYVSPKKVRRLLELCPHDVRKVVVTVDASLDEIQQYIDAGIDTVQLHGSEDAQFASSITGADVWKALRLNAEEQIGQFIDYPATVFVIDSFVKDAEIPGGTGKKADWNLALKFVSKSKRPVLLAGGINEDNAIEALKTVGCYGIDVSSGVEVEPGVKDHDKIIRLFEAIN